MNEEIFACFIQEETREEKPKRVVVALDNMYRKNEEKTVVNTAKK